MHHRVAFVPAFGLFCLGLFPQQTTGPGGNRIGALQKYSIRGHVRGSDSSQSLDMVKVQLYKSGNESVAIQFTHSNGEFEFTGLGNGVYQVGVDLEGYEPLRETVEISNSSRMGVTLFLTRANTQTRTESVNPISAHELSLPQKAREARQKGDDRLFQKADPKGSIPYFEKAIRQSPGYYEAYFDMGLAYLRTSQTILAEQSFRKSIELSDNKFAPPQQALAAVLCDRNEYAPAEQLARHSLDLGGTPAEGHFQLARSLFGLGRIDEAEKDALAAQKNRPDYAEVYLLLANINIRKQDYPALLTDLDAYLKLRPNDSMTEQVRTMRQKVELYIANASNTPPQSGRNP